MPPPDDVTRLRHIIDAAKKAIRFSGQRERSDLDNDEMLGFALMRLLEIIGEAARGISIELRAKYPGIAWRQMSGMRNRLIHEYFDVNQDLVWETVTRELGPLIAQLQNVLEKEGEYDGHSRTEG